MIDKEAKDMEGKVALVTGGASGIGRAAALAFASRGASVVVVDISEENGYETVRLIEETGGNGLFFKADVTITAEVQAMVDRAIQSYGHLDYAHNNAGIEYNRASIVDCTEEDWMRVMDINLNSVWRCMKYEIPRMLEQGGGAIVNTSSISGLGGIPNASPYIASKHGVIGVTKAAAVECANTGIRVNVVCPGVIDTPMLRRLVGEKSHRETTDRAENSRMPIGKPEEIAEAVVWLCSDAASFVNGHVMLVDGGLRELQNAPD